MNKRKFLLLTAVMSVLLLSWLLSGCTDPGEALGSGTETDAETIRTTQPTQENTIPETEPAVDPATENTPAEPETETDAAVTESEPETETETEAVTEPEPDTRTVIYQLAPESASLMMSYAIRTENGKIVLIDGGIDGYGKDARPYLLKALQAITGEDKPHVDAWFFTHPHSDHLYEFIKMVKKNKDDFTVGRFYFEMLPEIFPNYSGDTEPADIYAQFTEALCTFTGDPDFMKTYKATQSVTAGQRIVIDNAEFEVLQVCDRRDTNANDASMVIRMTANGTRVLFLADLSTRGGQRLLKTYGDDLKADIVQMAHHGQAGVDRNVYEAIDPSICLWPIPDWVWNNEGGSFKTPEVRGWMNALDPNAPDFATHHIVTAYTAKKTSETWAQAIEHMAIVIPAQRPDYLPAMSRQ